MVGLSEPDDAAIILLGDGRALVQTVDFFTPIVDDPFDWGRIAAANAVSDVYAMGGTPLSALQIVGWPREHLPLSVLADVMAGGAAILAEAGCALVGGHSVDDPEPKYGMAVTGLVHPDDLITSVGARAGDALVLTKPLGTGIITTALKDEAAPAETVAGAVAWMVELNAGACRAMVAAGATAATDVTGFGLLGHLQGMLAPRRLGARIDWEEVLALDGALELAADGFYPGGSKRNLAAVSRFTDFGSAPEERVRLLADAQTSGGLLIAIPEAGLGGLLEALAREKVRLPAVIGWVENEPGVRVR